MQTVIKKILSDRKRFLSLLLLADEQETMIDKYIGRGDMFVMYTQDGVAICSAIVTDVLIEKFSDACNLLMFNN